MTRHNNQTDDTVKPVERYKEKQPIKVVGSNHQLEQSPIGPCYGKE